MQQLNLDLFYEQPGDRCFVEKCATDLLGMVKRLAPHLHLEIKVCKTTHVVPWHFGGGPIIEAFRHEPTARGRQSMLITDRPIGGVQGWGTPNYAVVSKPCLEQKIARGGESADVLIHEWIHTIQGITINGRPVPFADDAGDYRFTGTLGPDGELRWEAWYVYALGG